YGLHCAGDTHTSQRPCRPTDFASAPCRGYDAMGMGCIAPATHTITSHLLSFPGECSMATDGKTTVSYGNAWVQTLQREPIPWIWDGMVAQDAITLLAAPEKTGKTTLLSLLLDRRREGGQLLGRAVRPGRTILCTEENNLLWALRQPPLDFGP